MYVGIATGARRTRADQQGAPGDAGGLPFNNEPTVQE